MKLPLTAILKHTRDDITLLFSKTRTYFSSHRKKVLILANCQGQALYSLLKKNPDFIKQFELIHIDPIHLLKIQDSERILSIIATLDVIIYQPIGSNYGVFASDNILKHLKLNAKAISFPVAYFTGYNPEVIYLKNFDGKKVSVPFDYNDLNIMRMFAEKLSIPEIVNHLESNTFYSQEFLERNCELSLNTLAEREKGLDIRITPFIENNYKSKRLFFSMNHPSNEVLFEIVQQLFELLGLQEARTPHLANELLGRTRLYLYPSVLKNFDLFSDNQIIIDNVKFSLENYVRECYTTYIDNRDLIQYNIESNEKGNDLIKQQLATRNYA